MQLNYEMPLGELREMRMLGYTNGVNDFQVAVNGFVRNATALQLITVEGDLFMCVRAPTPAPSQAKLPAAH